MKNRSILKKSVVISILSILINGTSFFSQILISNYIGPSIQLDTYLVSTSLPLFISALFVTLISYYITPYLINDINDKPPNLLKSTILFFTVISLTIFLLILLLFNQISNFYVQFDNGIFLLSFGILYFQVINSILNSRLIALKKAKLATISNIFPFIFTIASVYFFSSNYGINSIILGLISGVFFQFLFLTRNTYGDLVTVFSNKEYEIEKLKDIIKKIPIVILSMSIFSIYSLFDGYFVAKFGDSQLSYIALSHRLVIAIGTLITIGPTTLLIPYFAKYERSKAYSKIWQSSKIILTIVILVATPIILLVNYGSYEILRILFLRGNFNQNDLVGLQKVFSIHVIGMLPMIISVIMYRILFTIKLVKPQIISSIIWSVSYITWSLIAISFDEITFITFGYIFSWSISFLICIISLYRYTKKVGDYSD